MTSLESDIFNDLLKHLNERISEEGLGFNVNVKLLNRYQARQVGRILDEYVKVKNAVSAGEKISIKSKEVIGWERLNEKIDATLYIWGSMKMRNQLYVLEINTLVRHIPINPIKQQELQGDMSSVWLRRVVFDKQSEIKGFLISGDTLYIAAKYIIGNAAQLSFQYDTALRLHLNLLHQVENMKLNNPYYEPMKVKLPKLIAKDYCGLALHVKTMQEGIRNTELALKYEPSNYEAYLLQSIIYFNNGKPGESYLAVNNARRVATTDMTWRYNLAFLLMYFDKYEEALKEYDTILNTTFEIEPMVINEVLDFNESYFKSNPDSLMSLFIIGFILYKKVGNAVWAIKYIDDFIQKADTVKKYNLLLTRAKQYKTEIDNILTNYD